MLSMYYKNMPVDNKMNNTNTCNKTEHLHELQNNSLQSVNLFIAADIPQSVVPCLQKLQNELTHAIAAYPFLHYTPQKTYHITLAYFGSQNMQTLEQIVQVCTNIPQNFAHQKFTAHFHNSVLKVFGNTISREKVRMRSLKGGAALAITLQSNLYELAHALTQACTELVHNQTSKPFTPHLTMGRIRIVDPKNREKHERAAILDAIEKLTASMSVHLPNFTIPSCTLFESQGNGHYVPLLTCPLQEDQEKSSYNPIE